MVKSCGDKTDNEGPEDIMTKRDWRWLIPPAVHTVWRFADDDYYEIEEFANDDWFLFKSFSEGLKFVSLDDLFEETVSIKIGRDSLAPEHYERILDEVLPGDCVTAYGIEAPVVEIAGDHITVDILGVATHTVPKTAITSIRIKSPFRSPE